MDRLDKYLCDSGVGTRSQVKLILKAGRVTVDGKVVKAAAPSGINHAIPYFTLTYEMSGTATGVEAGELPVDNHWYLSGEKALLFDNVSLTNSFRTFDGWKIGNKVYEPGEEVPITATTVAKANWAATSISLADITVEDVDYTYDGTSQIPDVVVDGSGADSL